MILNKSLISLALATAVFFSACKKEDQQTETRAIENYQAPYTEEGPSIPGKYILTLNNTADFEINSVDAVRERIASIIQKHGISENSISNVYSGAVAGGSLTLTQQETEKLKSDPEINTLEPDKVIALGPTDPGFTTLAAQEIPYGIKRVGYGNGTGKTCWIIDSGIDLDHPDLLVDRQRSISFLGAGTSPDDQNGHGTHVAGIIAGLNNTIGVLGVAAGAKVVSIRTMDANGGGALSNVIAGVNYVYYNARPGDVCNMSVGGGISYVLDDIVMKTAKKGILFAVAAGNSSKNAVYGSPARVNHANVFTISAMNEEDNWASFSNYGNPPIDYCAPGVNILSCYLNGQYAYMSGTSMAAPHMAGLLLLKGKNILTSGFVKNDPDGKADPIAHL